MDPFGRSDDPFAGSDPASGGDDIDAILARAQRDAETAGRMAERMSDLRHTATSRDGAVAVTVAGSGMLLGLRLEEDVRRWAAAEISEEILRLFRDALEGLAEEAARVVDETVGCDSPTGRMIVEGFQSRIPPAPGGSAPRYPGG